MAQRKLLVTGACGYIGSALSERLIKRIGDGKDYHLILVDRLDFESDREFFYSLVKNPHVTFVKGDICNERLMQELMRDCYGVVNLAALVGEPLCRQKPEQAIAINEKAAKNLADISLRRGIKTHVQLSTCSNYGQAVETPAREESTLYPESLYAISKTHAETYLAENCPQSIILRCATAYGLSPRTRFDLLVNEFIKDAVFQGEISIFSPGVHRPIVHVDDIAKAIVLMLETPPDEQISRIYNVGSSDQNFTKGVIANRVAKAMGVKVNIDDSKIDPRDYIVDFTRIADQGFKCDHGLDDSIAEIKKAIDEERITKEEMLTNTNVAPVVRR